MTRPVRHTLLAFAVLAALAATAFIWSRQYRSLNTTRDAQPTAVAATPIRVAFVQALGGLPLYVAIDDGLFKANGLDARPEPFDSSDLAANQLKEGQAEIAFAGLSQLMQVEADRPGTLKIVAVMYSSTAVVAATRPGAPSSIGELRGRKIGIFPGNTFDSYVEHMLAAEGLARGSYELIKLPPPLQLQQLGGAEGGVDALVTLEPTGGQAVARGIGKYLSDVDLFAKHFLGGRHFPGGCIAVSREFLARNPSAAGAIEASLREAMARIDREGFEQAKYLMRSTKISEADAKILVFEGGEVGGDIAAEPLRKVVTLLKEWQKLPAAADLDRAIAP